MTAMFEISAHTGLAYPSISVSDPVTPQTMKLDGNERHDLTLKKCGSSPAEARKLGCSFDGLSFAWQVPECYDQTTVEEFLEADDWQYYEDEAGTAHVPHHLLSEDEGPVHVSARFHAVHCLFLRRQMVRLLQRGAPMDTHLGTYKHTVHCHNVLTNATWMGGELHTRAPVIYPECWPLEDWRA
ncbi:hypothetical protein AAL_06498 [Moelleriella libera RCEF 2490]|uniref:Uncharacterized protein n=1 Tax=Moelleriella libera RCEF 2490 TaxID=1081109 RepID=A0A167YTK0_9HYPO|nr:hypothetical protein AAL_06498 [Moelleriella libera RCEF 2490]